MKVLVACEESQAVCKAFRARGHEAYSCDILPCSGGHPEWHIQQDVLPLLDGDCVFLDSTGGLHSIQGKWDMLIAFPPCTYLSNAGAARLYKVINGKTYIDRARFEKGLDAKEFFMRFYTAQIEKIAIENPIPSAVYRLPKASQMIQPYDHGHKFSKKTYLWLKGLPCLIPTNIVRPDRPFVQGGSKKSDGTPRPYKGAGARSPKVRSKTFPGIARAMAEQWGITDATD